jgi:hypothetical protein
MYYLIKHDTKKENIGDCYPQTSGIKNPEIFDDPAFIDKIGFKKTNTLVKLPIPILHKNAIITDLISSITRGTVGRLIISEKLKKILFSANDFDMEFLKINVISSQQEELLYWLINPVFFQMSYIAYPKSDIQVVTWGESVVRNIRINDFADFKYHEINLKMPERLNIVKLFIRKEIESNFFILNSISGGGFCYFISEKVKQQIESQGCTGILFEPISVA